MKSSLEREVKLRPGRRFERLELPGRDLPEQSLVSEYHDTDDLRLAAGSITLRRRTGENGGANWQLKLPRADGRLEVERPADGAAVPDELTRLLVAHSRGQPLERVATLRTRRAGVVVESTGTDVAEVVHDIVEVMDDGRAVRTFEEIEVELLNGDAAVLRKLERTLREAGAEDPDGRSKLFQALDIQAPKTPRATGDTPADVLVGALRQQYRRVLDHDPGTRLGDPDELHDHRVAIRRLRALLRAGRPLLDRQWADDLRRSLRRAGRELAEVRDLDVLVADLEARAMELPELERAGSTDLLELLRDRRERARAELLLQLGEPWYVSVLNRVEQAVAEPRLDGSGPPSAMVAKEHRRTRRLVRKLPANPSDAELHEVRKAAKRARYAAEFAAAAGVSGMKGYVKRAKAVQDVLGEHQDAVVAMDVLRDLDGLVHRPMAHVAAEALIESEAARRTEARAGFPKAWRRLQRRARSVV